MACFCSRRACSLPFPITHHVVATAQETKQYSVSSGNNSRKSLGSDIASSFHVAATTGTGPAFRPFSLENKLAVTSE